MEKHRSVDIEIMARSYDTFGSDATLSLLPALLLRDAGDFGPALAGIELTFHFATSGAPRRTLEDTFATFHAQRGQLPKVVFRRKQRRVAIDVASDVLDGGAWARQRGLSLDVLKGAANEAVAAMALLRKRFKPGDDFDIEGFLAHVSGFREALPADDDALQAFARKAAEAWKARAAAQSPWERLAIDWSTFHPDARALLDDPFFWDETDDFAPHGNDTGADLLEAFRSWSRRSRAEGGPVAFLHRLLASWGLPGTTSGDVFDEAVVALAFAQIKLQGRCASDVRGLALEAIGRQRDQAHGAHDWPHRQERLASLDKVEARIASCVDGG